MSKEPKSKFSTRDAKSCNSIARSDHSTIEPHVDRRLLFDEPWAGTLGTQFIDALYTSLACFRQIVIEWSRLILREWAHLDSRDD
jgi:hypothetical protein